MNLRFLLESLQLSDYSSLQRLHAAFARSCDVVAGSDHDLPLAVNFPGISGLAVLITDSAHESFTDCEELTPTLMPP